MNWNCKLKTDFEDRGFVESLSDPCVFISKEMIILVYVDEFILISKEALFIQNFIKYLKSGTEGFIFPSSVNTKYSVPSFKKLINF